MATKILRKKILLLRINIPYVLYFGSQYFNINWINHTLSVQPGCSSPDNVHSKAECSALLITSLFELRVNANYQSMLWVHTQNWRLLLWCSIVSILLFQQREPSITHLQFPEWPVTLHDKNIFLIEILNSLQFINRNAREFSAFLFHHSVTTLQQNIICMYQNWPLR